MPRPSFSAGRQSVALDFEIDGARIREVFACHRDEDACTSTTFAPNVLIAALKAGNRARISMDSKLLVDFTLSGSMAAINRLAGCVK